MSKVSVLITKSNSCQSRTSFPKLSFHSDLLPYHHRSQEEEPYVRNFSPSKVPLCTFSFFDHLAGADGIEIVPIVELNAFLVAIALALHKGCHRAGGAVGLSSAATLRGGFAGPDFRC